MSPQKPFPNTDKVNHLRRLSHLLDNAIPIPGTGYRLGLDPILGLMPGGGDTIAGILGAYIVVEAARIGLPRQVIGKMVGNILFDSVIGTVPVLGDLFDVAWKANVRNIALLEEHLHLTQKNRKSDSSIFNWFNFSSYINSNWICHFDSLDNSLVMECD